MKSNDIYQEKVTWLFALPADLHQSALFNKDLGKTPLFVLIIIITL